MFEGAELGNPYFSLQKSAFYSCFTNKYMDQSSERVYPDHVPSIS